jgi:predicted dehydrogenase
MVGRLRLGVIGTSDWTELMYLNNLKDRDDVEIAGIAGRNRTRLAEVASKYRIPATFTDYRQLIADGGLDAIVVATPDDQHLPMALAAIDNGLHVLCEKPLATDVADARRMLEAAQQRGVKHMVLFTWRWQPHYQYLKSMIESGTFGDVYRAQFSFITGFARDNAYQWRLDPQRANGSLGDLASHMIDLITWYFGDVATVSATLGSSISRAHIAGHEAGSGNDSAHLSLGLTSGVLGVVDATTVSHCADMLVKHIVRIEAEQATLELEHIFFGEHAGTTIRLLRADEQHIRALTVPRGYFGSSDPNNMLDIYAREPVGVLGFVAAIHENRWPQPDFAVGVKVQEVVDAALRSHHERRAVDLA